MLRPSLICWVKGFIITILCLVARVFCLKGARLRMYFMRWKKRVQVKKKSLGIRRNGAEKKNFNINNF